MGRLREHLEHIRTAVVPGRGAAQGGLEAEYAAAIEERAQPPHLVRGLEQWNAGHFYEQHETLEWLWRATDDPVRDALKGIIQGGVGAYHVRQRNRRGALGKWTGAIGYLAPFEGLRPYGIDIAGLRGQLVDARDTLLDDEGEPPNWADHLARVAALRVAWAPRLAEPRVTALLRRLDRAWHESPMGVERTIAGLAEAEAGWKPPSGGHSIRTTLEQLALGKGVVTDRCFGEQTLTFEAQPAPDDWRRFRRWLTEQHEALREPLGFLHDRELDDGRAMFDGEVSIEHIIEVTIERDFFHAGEINFLRERYQSQGSPAVRDGA